MTHQVFISYSTRDKEIAAEICAALEERDMQCWIAPRNISGGSDWGEAIVHAIKQARILLLVFSTHANNSEQVKREIALAVGNGLFLLPIRIDEVEPRSSLQYFLSTSHWLDALERPIEPAIMQMVDTVERALAEPNTDQPQMGELTRMSFAVAELSDAESEIRAAAKADANKPRRGRGVHKETVASAVIKLHENDEMEGRRGRDQTRMATAAATVVAQTPEEKEAKDRASTADQKPPARSKTMTLILPVWQERFWFSKLAIVLLLAIIVVLVLTRGSDDQAGSLSDLPAQQTPADDSSSTVSNGRSDTQAISESPDEIRQSIEATRDESDAAQQIELPPEQTTDVEAEDSQPIVIEPPELQPIEPPPIEDELTVVVTSDNADVQEQVNRLLLQAQEDMAKQRFVSPAGSNALDRYREVLSVDPGNVNAKVGIRRIARAYIALATDAMDKGHLSRAGSYLAVAADTDPESPDVSQAYRRLAELEDQAADDG